MAVSKSWCIEGTQELADAVLKDSATPEDKEIFLFSNDATITKDTTDSDLTEITTNGGEKKDLTKATWSAATAEDPVVSAYNGSDGITWDITGDLTIYGYAVRGKTSGKIYVAENKGVNTLANGNKYALKPFELKFDIV